MPATRTMPTRIVFGREPEKDRRGFQRATGLTARDALIGASILFHCNMPSGFIPEALPATPFKIQGKDGVTVLNDPPNLIFIILYNDEKKAVNVLKDKAIGVRVAGEIKVAAAKAAEADRRSISSLMEKLLAEYLYAEGYLDPDDKND